MPEGDSLHRVAARLQVLVGERVEVAGTHPRTAAIAERLDRRRLESVRAAGKNLLLGFEGGLVLRSHLRMRGHWQLRPRGTALTGRPWLVIRGARHEAVLWHGPVLELGDHGIAGLGPDILADPLDLDAIVASFRREPRERELGDALLDQRLVAGIGNLWKAEALWEAQLSPWLRLDAVSDEELRALLRWCASQMRASVEGKRRRRRVYRQVGRPCPRCGETIQSQGQGDANRIAYWCSHCQPSSANERL